MPRLVTGSRSECGSGNFWELRTGLRVGLVMSHYFNTRRPRRHYYLCMQSENHMIDNRLFLQWLGQQPVHLSQKITPFVRKHNHKPLNSLETSSEYFRLVSTSYLI